ncbi:MAG: hypothetical protein U0165_05520 [Polyangiaceae bacterium]
MPSYVVGDATRPYLAGPAVIAHVCNDVGAWGAGFVLAVTRRWRAPEEAYRRWFRDKHAEDATPPEFSLGAVQWVPVQSDLWVANLIGQQGLRRAKAVAPVRYDAIELTLSRLATLALAHQASIHMPRIGCGLAGGTWDKIAPLIERQLESQGLSVTIYDLERA